MSKNKDLGTAYGMKKRAKGGRVQRERPSTSEGQKGWTHEKDYTKGVHREQGGGESRAGQALRAPNYGSERDYMRSKASAVGEHRRHLKELKEMPKPNLPMAKGGRVGNEPDRNAQGSAQRANTGIKGVHKVSPHYDKSRHKITHGKSKMGSDIRADNSVGKDLSKQEITDNIEMSRSSRPLKGLASGGTVTPKSRPDTQQSPVFKVKARDEESDKDINDLIPMDEAEDMGDDGEPMQPEDSDTEITDEDTMDDHMAMMADGGELEMDHHESMVAAIMSRRDQLHAEIDSGAHDLDEAVRMADGGMVDIDENAEEQPNELDSLNEDAIMKENFDSDMDDVSEPEDSNEHSDEIDSDDHDMVSKIRKGMKRRQR